MLLLRALKTITNACIASIYRSLRKCNIVHFEKYLHKFTHVYETERISYWGSLRIPALWYRNIPWPRRYHPLYFPPHSSLPLILNSRSFRDLSFLSVFAFHYRVRYLVGTFSSMLRCLSPRATVSNDPFLFLRLTEVHAYFGTRSGHACGARRTAVHISRRCAYIDVYLDIGV